VFPGIQDIIEDKERGTGIPLFDGRLYRIAKHNELKNEEKLKVIRRNTFFDNLRRLNFLATPEGIPITHEGKDIGIPKFIR